MGPQQVPQYPAQFGEEETSWDRFKGKALELIEFVAIVGVVVLVIHFFVAEPHQVSGSSMVPNFHNREFIITNKISTRFFEIKRYEVIIFKSPREQDKVFIKRVIGLSGERVKIVGGRVYINANPLREPYLPPSTLTQAGAFMSEGEEITIPADQYFVLGDNRGGSSDSREWGPVKKDLIIGQAFFRYWPIPNFGLIKTY